MSTESAREETGRSIPGIFLKLSTARAVIDTAQVRHDELVAQQGEVPGQTYIDAMYDHLIRTVDALGVVYGTEYVALAYGLWTIAAAGMRKEFGDDDALRGESPTSLVRQRADMAAWAIRTVVDQVNDEVNFAQFMDGTVFKRPVEPPPPSA